MVDIDSRDWDGSGGSGGDGTGVVGRLVVLTPFVGKRAGWDNING
jgi:hypothetical protein